MPRYDYACPNGHVTERIAPMSQRQMVCECGFVAKRQAVNRIATLKDYGSTFVMPSSVREAIDESVGYKHIAQAELHEAVQNGWKPKE